jgi:hypothetical protein
LSFREEEDYGVEGYWSQNRLGCYSRCPEQSAALQTRLHWHSVEVQVEDHSSHTVSSTGIGVADGSHLESVEQSLFAVLVKDLAPPGAGRRGLRVLSARMGGWRCLGELKKTSSRCVGGVVGGLYGVCIQMLLALDLDRAISHVTSISTYTRSHPASSDTRLLFVSLEGMYGPTFRTPWGLKVWSPLYDNSVKLAIFLQAT